jgi:hypothetical protein
MAFGASRIAGWLSVYPVREHPDDPLDACQGLEASYPDEVELGVRLRRGDTNHPPALNLMTARR